jgi:hypothetical protein
MAKTTKATKRKRKKDKDDDALALQVAEWAGVTNYMRELSGEKIREKGELYLRQGAMIAGLPMGEEKISTNVVLNVPTETKPEKTNADVSAARSEKTSTAQKLDDSPEAKTPSEERGISTTAVLIPESTDEETEAIEMPEVGKDEKISTTAVLNPVPVDKGISTTVVLNNGERDQKISTTVGFNLLSTATVLNRFKNDEKISTATVLNRFPLSTTAVLNLQPIKVRFEQEHLIRFINGVYNILFYPKIDHRVKVVLTAILLKATCEKSVSTKVKANDLLRALGMSKGLQKALPDIVTETGLAEVTVRKKAGTEVTFNEEIFKPNHKNSSKSGVIDRLIDIYNLSIYLEKNNEEKVEEKKSIPLQEMSKYISMLSLHLAGFPLKSVTESLIEAIKGKDPELIVAFWIYARNNSSKIKTPSAYLIKVINNNDTGNLSGEIMESAKGCVKAAQVIVRENYDEPELSFLRALAQKLSIPGRWDKEDRKALTAKLQMAGRELVKECEKVLGNLSKGSKDEQN